MALWDSQPSDALWTGPTGGQSSGSQFVGETENPGIIEAIQGLIGSYYPYATGYAVGAWAAAATSPSVQQAALLSGSTFASPTNANAVAQGLKKATPATIEYGIGSDGNRLDSSNPKCQFYIPPSAFVDPPAGAYPIVGLSYFLFYGKNQTRDGAGHCTDLKNLIAFIDSSTANNDLPSLEYSPLPTTTQTKIQAATTRCFKT